MNPETFAQRLARQMAENNPGFPVVAGAVRQPALGEKEKN